MADERQTTEKAWHRQPHESLPAFQAFQSYLALGDERSIAKVGQRLGKSRQLMERWSRRHHWQQRLLAWVDDQDHQRQAELSRERATMRDVALLSSKQLHQRALEALLAFHPVRKVMVGGREETVCTARPIEIVRMLEVAFKLQRAILGDVDDTTPTVIQVCIDGYDDEQEVDPNKYDA